MIAGCSVANGHDGKYFAAADRARDSQASISTFDNQKAEEEYDTGEAGIDQGGVVFGVLQLTQNTSVPIKQTSNPLCLRTVFIMSGYFFAFADEQVALQALIPFCNIGTSWSNRARASFNSTILSIC
jgi:hypothetical protein